MQIEDDGEPKASQRVTNSERKRHNTNRVVDDEVECSNQDEQNEASQHGNEPSRKRGRSRRTNNADIGLSGASQSSAAISNVKRVTRSSARLM